MFLKTAFLRIVKPLFMSFLLINFYIFNFSQGLQLQQFAVHFSTHTSLSAGSLGPATTAKRDIRVQTVANSSARTQQLRGLHLNIFAGVSVT